MANLPTFLDLFRVGRNEALARQAGLALDSIERRGSDSNILVSSAAAAAEEVIAQLATAMQASFVSSAQGQQLDKLLGDRYGLARKVAASALGTVFFTTTTPNPAMFVIPKGTKLNTSAGTVFQTTQEVTFPTGSTGPVSVLVRSILAGANQQAKPNTITTIAGTIAGQPDDLRVTNPLATAGAADEEKDPEFRQRGLAFFSTARRGTLAAIKQGALSVEGVVTATAFEELDVHGRPARQVYLAITDTLTEPLITLSSTIPSYYATQSNALAQKVFDGLDNYRAAGIFVQVQVAKVVLVNVVLTLNFIAGVDYNEVAYAARVAVVNFINSLPPGRTLDPADIVNVLTRVPGLQRTGNGVTAPQGPVIPHPLQVLRTSIPLVVATNSNSGLPMGQNPGDVGVC
jgi:uncharacterized phage protein gp47/JayE